MRCTPSLVRRWDPLILSSTLRQDTSPVPSMDGTAEFSPSWKLLRFGMELAITSWLAHQIIVRVVRVFNVSVFTADIKAESSVKRTSQKCNINNLIALQESKKWIKSCPLASEQCYHVLCIFIVKPMGLDKRALQLRDDNQLVIHSLRTW